MNRFLTAIGLSAGVMLSACEKKAVSIAITPSVVKLGKAGTQTLAASGTDTDGGKVPVAVTWSSSDNKVATVEPEGKISAVGSGTALITATQEALTGRTAVVVEIPTALKLDPADIKITKLTEKPKITASVMNEKNMPLVNTPVKFESENVMVASVDSSGVVTGMNKGVTKIIATFGSLKAEAKVVVEAGANEKVATAKVEKKAAKKK